LRADLSGSPRDGGFLEPRGPDLGRRRARL